METRTEREKGMGLGGMKIYLPCSSHTDTALWLDGTSCNVYCSADQRRVKHAKTDFQISNFTSVFIKNSLAGCALWEFSSEVVVHVSIGH